MLSTQFFTVNRKKISHLVNGELIVVTAGGLVQRTGDTVYPFRQDSNFYYLTGVIEPDVLLVVDGEDEFLVLPKRNQAEIIFGGSINCDEIAKNSGVSRILENKPGWGEIKKLQQRRKKLHTIKAPPTKVTHTDNLYTNGARKNLIQKLKRQNPSSEILDLRTHLTKLRQIKQPEEITTIKQAISVTAEGLQASKNLIEPGIRGFKLKSELDRVFTSHGYEHGFSPIIVSGHDTGVIHSMNFGRVINNTEPVLYDVGAEVDLYSADIARTYSSTTWTDRQLEVREVVLKVRQAMFDILKPGLTWREYAEAADRVLGQELMRLGIIKSPERKLVRPHFPHAIGHSLGLDVHDACDYTVIQENMVLTIEPGLYISEYGFGMRIEDDVLITKNGVENLSQDIPL